MIMKSAHLIGNTLIDCSAAQSASVRICKMTNINSKAYSASLYDSVERV